MYFKVIKKSFDFTGRSTPKEFWTFMGIHALILFGFMLIDNLFGPVLPPGQVVGQFTSIYFLLTLPANLSVTARRLRDASYSPWWMLLMVVPAIGWFVVTIMCFRKSR